MLSGIDELRKFKIFAELDEADFEAVARIAQIQEFEAGEKLTTEGVAADQLYLFLKGRASVRIHSPEGGQVVTDELGPGDLLGWAAVMPPHVYTASAWTAEPSRAIVLPGKRLRDLCEANKRIGYQVAKGIGEVISKRFGRAVAGRGGQTIGGHEPNELQQFGIFAGLDMVDLDAIARISHVQEFAIAEQLTTEGALADNLYLVLKGKVAVKVRSVEGRPVLIDELGPGELLGWAAVMEPHVYTASAWATEPSEVIVVPGVDLRALCEANKMVGYQVAKGISEVMSRRFGQAVGGKGGQAAAMHGVDELHQFKLFAELDLEDLDSIARIAHVQQFEVGEQLTAEGAEAKDLYLFLKGRAAVKVLSPEGQQVLIDELGPGELLGWAAVMPPHVYTASAWTTEPAEVIVVPGAELRALCEADPQMGYQVAKGLGEVMSRRFDQTVAGHGIDELHQFKIFAGLDLADLDAIARISHIQEYESGEQLTAEGATADKLYLVLKGKVTVKVTSPDGRELLIDELGPGEPLGWAVVMQPHVYPVSAWTSEPCDIIVVPGDDLRALCEADKHMGYQVAKGIGEVISRRFGQAIGGRGDARAKDLRAFGGEERVVWEGGALQLTTQAILIGMDSDSPDVIPLEAIYDVEVRGLCVVFHVHGGDVCSPPLDDPGRLASLVRGELMRTRYVHRRRDYIVGSS